MNPGSPTPWTGRRVLVTGASGFIGSALVRALERRGAIVRAVSRRDADLARIDQCRALFQQAGAPPQCIMHLAGHPFAARDLSRVIPTFTDNLQTTVNILTTAAEHRAERVVLAGSLEEPATGDPAGALSSPYAMSKWAAAAYAQLFHTLYSTPVVTARLFMVYGPGQHDPKKLIPSVVRSLLAGEPPRISSGERPVDWIYIDDVVDGLISAAMAPGIEGRTVDIGTGILTTVRGVVETLVSIVPSAAAPQFGAIPSRPNEQVRAARVDETAAATGWRARVPLREGLERTAQWIRAGGAP